MDAETRRKMHSSNRADWRTPTDFWKWINGHFGFAFDVDWSSPIIPGWPEGRSALYRWPELQGVGFCNPPYGDGASDQPGEDVYDWLVRGEEACRLYSIIVAWLLPARTDTAFFHRFAKQNTTWLLKGRLNFDDNEDPAPFPSCVIIQSDAPSEGIHCVDWRADLRRG